MKNHRDKKKLDFVENKIKRLDKEIIALVYIEIIRQCIKLEEEINSMGEKEEVNKEFNFIELKNFIFDKFANKLDDMNDIENIIKLINCLEGDKDNEDKDKCKIKNENIILEKEENKNGTIINDFFKKLMKKNLFTKEEYFSGKQNLKITLLYKLYEHGKIKKTNENSIFKF